MLLSFIKSIIALSSLTIMPISTSMMFAVNASNNNQHSSFNSNSDSSENPDEQKNSIEAVMTTSNPNKIMLDYQNHILDNKQIYSPDYSDFKTVYRDAFGNTTQDITAALKTYSNSGLVKIKYSYDHNKWFDSIEEAKDNYVNNAGIRKSLYYYINGRYYNVFNKQDQEILKNSLQEGYQIAPNGFHNKEKIFGTAADIKKIVAESLQETWGSVQSTDELNYKNFMDFNSHHSLSITCDSTDLIGYWHNSIYYRNARLEIDDPTNEISSSLFNSEGSGWKYDTEWWGNYHKDKWTKLIHTQTGDYLFEFKPKTAHLNGSKFYWNKVTVEEKFDSQIYLYDRKITDTNKKRINHWESHNSIHNYSEIPTDTVLQAYQEWFDLFYDQEFLKFDGSETTNKYGVTKDLLYAANGEQGYKYSLAESQKYYESVYKPEILKGKTKINDQGETTYELKPDFYVTKNQLDNYLFLNGNVDTRLMYTFLNVQDISSLDGSALTNNIYDAEFKEFQLNNNVLFYCYYAYDVFGDFQTSSESESDVLQKLYNTISLQAKLISSQEIDSWHQQIKSFDSIVEDGNYQIYRIFSERKKQQGLDPYIYFDSYNAALKAIDKHFI